MTWLSHDGLERGGSNAAPLLPLPHRWGSMGLNMVDDEKPRISPGKAQFLAAFEVSANVAQACRVVGWSRANAYKHRANDPEFAAVVAGRRSRRR